MVPAFAGSRIAPAYFHGAPTLRSQSLWRSLVWAVVPVVGGDPGGSTPFTRSARELVRRVGNTFNGGVTVGGNACGPCLRSTAAALQFPSMLPSSAPLSVFGFLANRGSSATQAFVSGKGLSSLGWTFQMSYAVNTGRLGLTRWGVADEPTTGLTVPSGGAHSAIGLAHNGTTARFFLNGKFENVASGAISTGGNPENIAFWYNGGSALENADVYVIYVWSRVVTDAEFLWLMQDPWACVRPMELPYALTGGAAATSGRRSFIPGIIG